MLARGRWKHAKAGRMFASVLAVLPKGQSWALLCSPIAFVHPHPHPHTKHPTCPSCPFLPSLSKYFLKD